VNPPWADKFASTAQDTASVATLETAIEEGEATSASAVAEQDIMSSSGWI